MGEFKEVVGKDSISIYYIEGSKVCSLDACMWSDGGMFIKNSSSKVMTVNRLFVHKELRNKGIGTELMERLFKITDKAGYTLELGVSPYGDGGPEEEELIEFYTHRGFKQVTEINDCVMVRECNKK